MAIANPAKSPKTSGRRSRQPSNRMPDPKREFRKLWLGQTISEIGSRITREGIPLTAVMTLGASPAQMGILSAIGSASVLLFSLSAGVIADRVKRRPIMLAADFGRAL